MRTCSVCRHERRKEINFQLVAGTPYRDIAERFGVTKSSLSRHAAEHLPKALERQKRRQEEGEAQSLLVRLQQLSAEVRAILETADPDPEIALRAVARLERHLELEAKLSGDLKDGQQSINVLVAPEWVLMRNAMLKALRPYPEAKQAVLDALAGLAAVDDAA
jgi:transposase